MPLGRLLLRTTTLNKIVPRRFMSSVPGGTGENLVYLVLCGGAFAGALTYAYRTVTSDSARFTDRIKEIEARPKNDRKPKTWPPKNAEEEKDIAEEEVEPATEATKPPAEAATEPPAEAATEPPAEAATEPPAEAATEPPAEAATEPPAEAATEPPAEAATEPPAESTTEKATAAPVELVAEVEAEKPDSMVEAAAEAVAVATERVVEVDGVVKETAEEVTAVVQEVEKIVEEVEAALVVKEETHSQEEAVTESANTEA
ncbi:Protein MGARP [Bagarius yarrelli]|uniref:Protein MGARP n=1 Tax=Bagarius yarrelli TaxID=175774 RepID=A0A556U8Z4_BAGYA|nr:Protein MGARP [Bagarius yarrelli]